MNEIDPKCLLVGASSGSLLLARCLTAGHSLPLSKNMAHSHRVVSINSFTLPHLFLDSYRICLSRVIETGAPGLARPGVLSAVPWTRTVGFKSMADIFNAKCYCLNKVQPLQVFNNIQSGQNTKIC